MSLSSQLKGRAASETGEDYPIARALVEGNLEPMQVCYKVVGHRGDDVLLLDGSFKLREAVTVYYSEDEIAELEAQAA